MLKNPGRYDRDFFCSCFRQLPFLSLPSGINKLLRVPEGRIFIANNIHTGKQLRRSDIYPPNPQVKPLFL